MCFSQEGKKLRFFRSSLLKIYLCATKHSKRYDRVQLGVLSTSTDSHPSYKYVHNEINLRLSTGNSSRDYAPAFPFPLTRSLRRVDGYKRSSRKCLYLHARALLVKNLLEFSAKVKPRIPVALLAQSARNTVPDLWFRVSSVNDNVVLQFSGNKFPWHNEETNNLHLFFSCNAIGSVLQIRARNKCYRLSMQDTED